MLLFKIRRSEPKLLEFQPKFGIVEPGVTRHVSLQLVNSKISFARVLVKLVAIKRSKLLEDFQASWALAATKGVVKKVVDVRNLAYNLGGGGGMEDDDMLSASLASEDIGDFTSPVLSPTSQMETMLEVDEDDDECDEDEGLKRTSVQSKSRGMEASETDKEAESGSEKVTRRSLSAASPAPSVLSPTSEALLREVGASGSEGDDEIERRGPAKLSDSPTSAFEKQMARPAASKPPKATAGKSANQSTAKSSSGSGSSSNRAVLVACSRARLVPASGHSANLPPKASTQALSSITVEVSGHAADDSTVAAAFAMRCVEKFDERCRVVAFEVSDTQLTTLGASVSQVFAVQADELQRMRAVLLEDHLRHLTVNLCASFRVLDASINRFARLATLDLSGNALTAVDGVLNLPQLHRLDVSNNNLTSLEFCCELRGLKTLVAKSNNISSIRAVQTLIPLAGTLTSVNLVHNPICQDLRYASTVVNILPKLHFFDARDVHAMGRSYSRAPTPSRGVSDGSGIGGPPPLPKDLAALNDQVAAADEDAVTQGIEMEFERRLKRAVKRKHSAAAPHALAVSLYSEDDSSSNNNSTGDEEAADYRPRASAEKKSSPHQEQQAQPRASSRSRPQSAPAPIAAPRSAFSRSLSSQQQLQFQQRQMAASASVGAMAPREFSQSLTGYTETNRAKRLSQRQGLVSHWAGHANEGPSDTPRRRGDAPAAVVDPKDTNGAEDEGTGTGSDEAAHEGTRTMSNITVGSIPARRSRSVSPSRRDSTLLLDTRAHILRMKAFGIPRQAGSGSGSGTGTGAGVGGEAAGLWSPDHTGYYSEDGTQGLTSKSAHSARAQRRANTAVLRQRTESERFGIYHPRYRVPKKTFGFSRPFVHTHEPSARVDVPLFDKFVQRLRDGFEKLPTRGTFTRASKGLMAEWYPMDYTEVEAIRRQGFFHDVIGFIQKYSYQDLRSMEAKSAHPSLDVSVDRSGKTMLTPHKGGRRGTNVKHQSRQYKTMDGTKDTNPADEFSDYRKWNPQLWSEHGNNPNASRFEPGQDVDGLQGKSSPRKTAPSRASILDGSFQRHEQSMSMSLDASDFRVVNATASSWPKSMQQQPNTVGLSWQGQVQEHASRQVSNQQREEQQLTEYMKWLEQQQSTKAVRAPKTTTAEQGELVGCDKTPPAHN